MAFLAIDRKRFEYLLLIGTEEHELRQFFEDSRKALIFHGAKVQHLPKGHLARIKSITSDLPSKTDVDVQAWFSKYLTVIDPIDPPRIVEEFKLYEELREDLPPDEARRLARSCLFHLFKRPVPEELVQFLRTPLDDGEVLRKKAPIPESHTSATALPVVDCIADLPKIFFKLLSGEDIDELATDLPDEIGTYLVGLQAAKLGNFKRAHDALDALKADSSIRTGLEDFIRHHESDASHSPVVSKGAIVHTPQSFDGMSLEEGDQVLAYCSNASRPAAVFLRPLGVLRSGIVRLISETDAHRLFPDTGSLISFVGPNYPKQPIQGELGIWSVSEHETDKKTHFHLSSEKRSVYVVRTVPFPSSDPDSVRRFLQENHSATRTSPQPSLYELSDGLILSARSERSDLARDEAFELGLPAYESLSAFRLEGRLHVVGPLPKESLVFDCGDLGSAVRALFRSRNAIGPLSLSKSQIRELANSLSGAETSLSSQRINRLEGALHRLEHEREAFDAAIAHIQTLPETEARVQEYVQSQASSRLLAKSEVEAEIARLQRERLELDVKLAKQREDLKKLKDDTARTVKLAFDKARSDGLTKLLADVAIFEGVSSLKGAASHGGPASLMSQGRGLRRVNISFDAESDVPSLLRRYGVSKRKAAAFICVAKLAQSTGLVVGFRGVLARPVVRAWAEALGPDCSVFEGAVGLVDDEMLAEVCSTTALATPLVLLDANLSALDLYARPISDKIFSHVAGERSDVLAPLFMVLSAGIGALPVSSAFKQLMLVLDFEKEYVFSKIAGDRVEYTSDEFLGLPAVSSLWVDAGRRLFAEFALLGSDEQELVCAILAAPE